ncbi:MAG: guanylate kinase [Bacillota bacterium]|jgi:guanylate kinase|nr:guanylate kinase [Bacillota bacterium]HHU43581.1 guanylate kinase [Clostridiales bacterium]
MRKGILFVISGPSGAGKGTVLKEVFKKVKDLTYSVSATTRKPRHEEKEGINYFFKTDEEFDQMIKNGEMLEYVNKYGSRYGTIKSYIEKVLNEGKDIILEIETIGAQKVKKTRLEPVSIFLTPSKLDILTDRLKYRNTESPDWQQRRLQIGIEEMMSAYDYDYLVINDDLENAVDEVVAIIKAERLKVKNNKDLIDRIINKGEKKND